MRPILVRIGLAGVLAVILLTGGPASSASAMCEGHIAPVRPDGTPVGWFLSPPNVGQHQDSSGAQVDNDYPSATPFDDPTASWSDSFGYSSHWNTYDLGCGPDAAHAPLAGPFTAFGNLMLEIAKFPVAVLSQVQEWLTSDPFSWLDPVTATIADKIKHNVWLKFFPLSLIVLGLVFVWQSRRADFNAALSATGWAVIVLTLSIFFLNYPQKANEMMTSAIRAGAQAASSSFSNGHFSDQVSEDIIYPQWLQGELGSSSSAAAEEYGHELYATQHLTWREAQRIDQAGPPAPLHLPDPDQTPQQRKDAQIPHDKDLAFKDVADKIKQADPTAYENLQGLHSENRLAAAFIMSVYTWTASLFMFMALAFLALALLMVRVVVIAAPIAAIVGLHERYRHTLKSVLNMFVAALVAVVKFTLAAGVFAVVVSGILAAPTNQALKLLLVLVTTVVAIMVVKPVRTLKTVIPAADPTTSYVKQALGYVLRRKAVEDGVEDGIADARSKTAASPAQVRSTRAEEESLEPIPVARPQRTDYRVFADGSPPGQSATSGAGDPAGVGYAVRQTALEPATASGAPGAPSPAQLRGADVSSPAASLPAQRGGAATQQGAALVGRTVLRPPPTTTDPAYGDIYSRSSDREHAESVIDDLPLSDSQLDTDGNEVFVVYRTRTDPERSGVPDEALRRGVPV